MADPVAAITSSVNAIAWPAALALLGILYREVQDMKQRIIELAERVSRIEGRLNGVRRDGKG